MGGNLQLPFPPHADSANLVLFSIFVVRTTGKGWETMTRLSSPSSCSGADTPTRFRRSMAAWTSPPPIERLVDSHPITQYTSPSPNKKAGEWKTKKRFVVYGAFGYIRLGFISSRKFKLQLFWRYPAVESSSNKTYSRIKFFHFSRERYRRLFLRQLLFLEKVVSKGLIVVEA